MKIAMVASEANPFYKTGGLGDVVFALSKQLVKENNEVYIFTPFYKTDKFSNVSLKELEQRDIQMNWRHNVAIYKETIYNGIHYVFIDQGFYYGRDGLYGYLDDAERFAFFTLAVLEFIRDKSFDVVHCHDWQSGMMPLLVKTHLGTKIKTLLTIHNEAFLGYFSKEQLFDLYNLDTKYFDDGTARYNNSCSSLKCGIIYCDEVTTVSPTHRNELLTPEGGNGLENVLKLRKDNFVGIVNGIDTDEFNPLNDKYIFKSFSKSTLDIGKILNKKDLLDTFKLPYFDGPIYGIVTRLTWQKGTSLVFENAQLILDRGGCICVLGSGERAQEEALENLRRAYPNRVGIYIGYSNQIAHKIYAGSDFFLMPSLFEPCGISQMISHRYATIPIVRSVGGLVDTVIGFNGSNINLADGITFSNLDYEGLRYAINTSLDLYYDQETFNKLRLNCLKVDHSWKKSCQKYINVYNTLFKE